MKSVVEARNSVVYDIILKCPKNVVIITEYFENSSVLFLFL